MSDREEFTAWARDRQHALLRTAILLTADRHRAQDLVQDALTKVALRWPRLAAGNPEAYARQIMVRDNVSWWRKHHREVVREPADRPDQDTPHPDRRLMLLAALARLTPRQRAVGVLRYYDDLTEVEIASTLGCSVGSVKTHASRGLHALAELIGGS